MPKPNISEVPEFYQGYIKAVEYDDLIPGLINSGNETIELLKSIPEAAADYRYAEGKWSIKELVAHMIDSERVFAYRALSFARNDQSELPGFEQDDWINEMNIESRKLYKLIEEYNNMRASTIDMFGSFSEEMLNRSGMANGTRMSVNSIGYVIIGHETHHRKILNERYFS